MLQWMKWAKGVPVKRVSVRNRKPALIFMAVQLYHNARAGLLRGDARFVNFLASNAQNLYWQNQNISKSRIITSFIF